MKIILNNEVAKRMAAVLNNINTEFVVLNYGKKCKTKEDTPYMQVQAISPTAILAEPVAVTLKPSKDEEIPEFEQIFLDIKTFTKLIYAVCAYDENVILTITEKQVAISTVKGHVNVKLGRLEQRKVEGKLPDPKEAVVMAIVKGSDLDAMLSKVCSRASETKDKSFTLSFRAKEKAIYGYGANGSGSSVVRAKIEAIFGKDGEPAEITERREKACEGSKVSTVDDYRVEFSTDNLAIIREFIQGSKSVRVYLDKTHLCVRTGTGILSCVLNAKESMAFYKVVDKFTAMDCEVVWQFDAAELDKALNIINLSQSADAKPCHVKMNKDGKIALVLPDNQGAKVDVKASKGETELEMWVNPMLLKKAISFKGNLIIKLIKAAKGGLFLVGPGTIEDSDMKCFELIMLCSSPDDNIAEEKPEKTAKAEKPKKEEAKEEPKKEEAPAPVKETEDSDEEDIDDTDDVEDIENEELDDDAEDVSDEDIPFEE